MPPVQLNNDPNPVGTDLLNDAHLDAQGSTADNSASNTVISPASASPEEISAVTDSYAQDSALSRKNTPAKTDAGAARFIPPPRRAAQAGTSPLAPGSLEGLGARGATHTPPAKRSGKTGPFSSSARQASARSLRKPPNPTQRLGFVPSKRSEESFVNALEQLPTIERLQAAAEQVVTEQAAANALDAIKDNLFSYAEPNDAAKLAVIFRQWNELVKQNTVSGDDNGFPKLTAHVPIGD